MAGAIWEFSRHKTEPALTLTREEWLASQMFIDAFDLSLHRVIAQELRQTPESVLAVARDNLQRWLASRNFTATPDRHALLEWCEILDHKPLEDIVAIITQDTDEGQRLRSSSPFAGVLSKAKRKEILSDCGKLNAPGAGM